MVVQYKEIDDIIDEKYTDEVVFKYIQELILATEKAKKALGDDGEAFNVERNEKLVMQAVIDAVEDLKRIHDFHPIEDANAIKEAAYFSFWLIKRKPMCFTGNLSEISGSSKEEIDKRKVNILFINEFCAAIYIMPKIFRLKKEVKELDKAYPNMDKLSNDWKKYFDNLIYFLSYRAESPKSIEAALTSLIMTPKWETNFDFWKVDEKNNYSKSAKWLVIGSSVVGGVVVIALILVAALLKNEVAANVASIVASILSAVLSIVAIIYTFHSNIQTDAKLKEILEMGKKMQKIETEIKEARGNPTEQTPELQEKLRQYEEDLELVDQFFK